MIPQPTDIAIITKDAVATTYKNQKAHLHAVIVPVGDDPTAKVRLYKVRTDLAVYVPIEVPVLDADDNPTGEMETKQQLTIVEQRQDWSEQRISYAEIDAFAAAVADAIPSGLTKTEIELLQLALVFKMERQNTAPWGVDASQWRLRTPADLLID